MNLFCFLKSQKTKNLLLLIERDSSATSTWKLAAEEGRGVEHGFTEVPPIFFTFATDMILFGTTDNIAIV